MSPRLRIPRHECTAEKSHVVVSMRLLWQGTKFMSRSFSKRIRSQWSQLHLLKTTTDFLFSLVVSKQSDGVGAETDVRCQGPGKEWGPPGPWAGAGWTLAPHWDNGCQRCNLCGTTTCDCNSCSNSCFKSWLCSSINIYINVYHRILSYNNVSIYILCILCIYICIYSQSFSYRCTQAPGIQQYRKQPPKVSSCLLTGVGPFKVLGSCTVRVQSLTRLGYRNYIWFYDFIWF